MHTLTLPRTEVPPYDRMSYAPDAPTEPVRGPLRILDAATGATAVAVGRYDAPHGELRSLLRSLDAAAGPYSGGRARRAGFSYRSETFGFGPRNPLRKRYGCTPCAMNREHPDVASALDGVAAQAAEQLAALAPDAYDRQTQIAAAVRDEWRLPGGLWTSGILNYTSTLPYHRDGNNFRGSWSAMLCLRYGIRGGELHLPEYGVTLAVEDRSIIMFCGSDLWHGVTPLQRVKRDGYRYTLVLYAVAAMAKCLPPAEEATHAQRARTEAEERIAAELARGR